MAEVGRDTAERVVGVYQAPILGRGAVVVEGVGGWGGGWEVVNPGAATTVEVLARSQ